MTHPLAATFATMLGRPPVGVWSAPGRVNLIGDHVDYNDGIVLPFAIGRRTAVALGSGTDARLTIRSLQRPGEIIETDLAALTPGNPPGWASYVAGVVWALAQLEPAIASGGLDLLVDGGVPVGSGLSSSAALECATALAVGQAAGLDLDRERLARLAQRAENDFVGMPCGLMDQMAAMVCTAGHALAFDVRASTASQIPLAPQHHGLALLVIDTRAHHALADGAYAQRRASCEAAASALGLGSLREAQPDQLVRLPAPLLPRARHVVSEISRVERAVSALQDGDLRGLGELMTASHASLRDDFEVSCAELDLAVATSLAAGAWGARMTGGGFGGSAIVLAPTGLREPVEQAVRQAFAEAGFTRPEIFPVSPAAGAAREV